MRQQLLPIMALDTSVTITTAIACLLAGVVLAMIKTQHPKGRRRLPGPVGESHMGSINRHD